MTPNNQELTFEQSMARLEQIVRLLERGEVTLDESLKLFQEGTALVRSCGKLLDGARIQVDQIASDETGAPVEEVFIHESDI